MPKNGHISIERKDWQLVATLLTALIVVVVVHFIAIAVLKGYEATSHIARDAYEGTALLRSLDHHLMEMENDVRSFALLKDEKYISSAENTARKLGRDIIEVRSFFRDGSNNDLLMRLEEMVNENIRLHKNVLDGYRQMKDISLADFPVSKESSKLEAGIMDLTDSLRLYHRQHLESYFKAKEKTASYLRWLSWISVFIVLAITLFSIFYLLRAARHRRDAEQARKQKQEELEKALEATERSSMIKEQFVANMSHEIRTPLNAILGFSNLLQRTDLDKNQWEFAHNIQTSSESLLAIVNDILDFSKIESGMLHIERIPFSLPGLLHSVENMFRYRADEKKLAFGVSVESDVPEIVLGDPTRLTQILVNLLGNAFKFTDMGSVTLRVKGAGQSEGKQVVRFVVEDTGIGIPADKKAAIFERFGQASADTTRKFGGAGLGLTITRQLVELQNGRISVDSQEGKGTAFTVEIPYEPAGNPEKKSGRQKPLNGSLSNGGLNVLIVEDNLMNQRIAELLLEGWKFQCELAENGKVALEKLRHQVYDLVLMDIQMPEMDGYTAARKIRQELHLDVPIIATTAHAFAGEREKCISYGMNDYISKPLDEKELLSLIQRYAVKIKPRDLKSPVSKVEMPEAVEGFDRQYVLDIAKGKPEMIQEMVALFIKQSAVEIERIESALQSNNFGEAATAAHSMKSTAAYMGFAGSLGEILKNLELAARDRSPDTNVIRDLFSTVKKQRNWAITQLQQAFSA